LTNLPPIPVPRKLWHAGTLVYTTPALAVLFLWLLWGDFAWQMKERSVTPVVQLLFGMFHASDYLTGIMIGSLPQIVGLLLGPIIAYRSDRLRSRWGRRIPFLFVSTPIVVISMVGLAFSPYLGPWLHGLLGSHSPGPNTLVLIFLGLFWTLFEVATVIANSVFSALINDVVPHVVIGRFFGFFRAVSLLAAMGFYYGLFGQSKQYYMAIFLGGAVLYGVGFLMVGLRVKEGEYPAPPPANPTRGVVGFVQATKSYFRECFGNPYYLWFYAYVAISWMAFMPVNVFNIAFSESIKMSQADFGLCMTITFATSFILAYPLGMLADRFHPLFLGIIFQALYACVTLWGGLFATDAGMFSIALVAHGVVSGTWMTATASIGQRMLPMAKFAQYGSAAGIVGAICGIAINPIMGHVLDASGHQYRYTYFTSSGLVTVALICGMVLYWKFKALGGPKHYVAPE